MRKSIAILSLSALFMGSAFADEYPYIRTEGMGKNWTQIDAWKLVDLDESGKAYPSDLESYPQGKDTQVELNHNFQSIFVDADVVLKSLTFNRDLGSAWQNLGQGTTATPTIDMRETAPDGDGLKDGSITIDLANKGNDYAIYSGVGTATPSGLNAYSQAGTSFKVENMILTFEGGSVNLTDSSENKGTHKAVISLRPGDNIDFTGRTYEMRFNSLVNSTENVTLEGRLSNYADTGGVFKFTFNNDLTLFNGDDATDKYKVLTLTATSTSIAYDAAGNVVQAGNYALIGENATATVRRVKLEANSVLQVDGVLETQQSSNKYETSQIASGALLIVNGTFNMVGQLSVYGKAIINGVIDNSANIDDPYVQIGSKGEMVIGENAQKVSLGRTGLRLYKGAKLSINSASAFDDNSTRMWFFKPNTVMEESSIVEFNANAKLLGFTWQEGTSVVFKFAEDVEVLLKTFSLNEGSGANYHGLKGDVSLTLEGYKNGMIRITSLDNQDLDDLTLIKATGFEDGSFRWEFDDASNSYWLVGTAAVPEPATVAAVFGLFAMGFVLYRRRR